MTLADRIFQLLKDHGPMTAREIAEELGLKWVNQVAAALGEHKGTTVRISGYRRDTDGGRLYPRALYALGKGEDAPKLDKLTRSEYNSRARKKRVKLVASVFELGLQKRAFDNKTVRQQLR